MTRDTIDLTPPDDGPRPGAADLVLLLLFVAAGVAARVAVASRGHNFDMESWQVAVDLQLAGQNVYAHTPRYNYGPLWFLTLRGLWQVHAWLGVGGPESFHMVVAAFLSLVDVGLAVFLFRAAGLTAAAFLMLNPISVLLTGFHSQIDNAGVLMTLLSWWVVRPGRWPVGARRAAAAGLVLGLGLSFKHVAMFFPPWVLFCRSIGPLRWRALYALVAYGVFAALFLPFLDHPNAAQGVYKNVLAYRSLAPDDALLPRVIDLFVPHESLRQALKVVPVIGGLKVVFLLAVTAAGFYAAVRRPRQLVADYLLCFVLLATSMADQYLAIPLVAVAASYRRWPAWVYTVVGTVVLFYSRHNIAIAIGTVGDSLLRPYHAQVWLAFLWVGTDRVHAWLRRALRWTNSLFRDARRPDSPPASGPVRTPTAPTRDASRGTPGTAASR